MELHHNNSHSHPIMVIEDDDDIRELMKSMLEAEGYSSITASNGEEGLELLSTTPEKPCMILLDMMMPIMDGWTFSEEAKKNVKYRNIPLLAVTAFSDQMTLRENFQGILRKPIRLDLLLDVVRHYCPSKKLQ
ncbi:hypothetical protein CIK05_12545 [Bdellovibrio sp. qaytius]|nr:hypothetical protein CIK05_12545 [Bdellovibrio sp. qaytius]